MWQFGTRFMTDFFPNDENLQVANWQIDTDTLIVIIKAKSQNFLQRFRDCTTRNRINVYFYNSLFIQIVCALYRNE